MTTITISAKCADLFSAQLFKNGKNMGAYEGYVPCWFPNPNVGNDGDYISLIIDVDTGKIINWKKPTPTDLKDFKT